RLRSSSPRGGGKFAQGPERGGRRARTTHRRGAAASGASYSVPRPGRRLGAKIMPPGLLDPNAISDPMGATPALKARVGQHPDPITTCVIACGEIHYGLARLPAGKKRTDLESRANNILSAFRIEPVSVQIAESYGQLKASLESVGLNLGDNDL